MDRRKFLKEFGAAVTLACTGRLWAARRADRSKVPNILYIMSDDHAAHAISAYRSRLAKVAPTPNIDRLANEGILFENCFCTNSICVPSRATILELAGLKVPGYMQGRSFVPLLRGRTPADWPKSTYYRYWMHMAHHDNPAHFGVRTKEYKLIFFYGRNYKKGGPKPTQPGWELYDMKNDPYEMNNIYSDPKYAGIVKELKAELLRLRRKYNETDAKYPHVQKVIDEYWNK